MLISDVLWRAATQPTIPITGPNVPEPIVWIAIVSGVVAICKSIWDVIQAHRKERTEIDIALDQRPLIKEQLKLGNVGAAIEHITRAMEAQARFSERQEAEIQALISRVRHLENRRAALEAELFGIESEHSRLKLEHAQLKRDHDAMYKQLQEQSWQHTEDLLEPLGQVNLTDPTKEEDSE